MRMCERQAEMVRRIFQLYADGKGFGTIVWHLNDEGAPCPSPSLRRPAGWAPASVRQVPIRPVFRGEILLNRTEKRNKWRQQQRQRDESEWMRKAAEHMRIVSGDLWAAAHDRLRDTRSNYLRATGGHLLERPVNGIESKYLLTDLAGCTVCNSSLTVRSRAHGRHRVFFYACTCHVWRGQRACSNGLHLPM